MRLINFLVLAVAGTLFVAILGSLFFIDKTNHSSCYYVLEQGNKEIGDLKIDIFETSGSVIYKSSERLPYEFSDTEENIKITIDKNERTVREFDKEIIRNNFRDIYYLTKVPQGMAFLSLAKSRLAFYGHIEFKKFALPYNRNDVATWVLFFKDYDYAAGGTQKFDVIKYNATLYPPYQHQISIKSLREEYVNIDELRIRAECMLLKDGIGGDIFVWIDKADRKILAFFDEQKNRRMRLTEYTRVFEPKICPDYREGIVIKNVSFFANGKEFSGKLTKPLADHEFPAVVICQGEDSMDEDNFGLSASLARFLSSNGYVVLRYALANPGKSPRTLNLSVDDEKAAVESAINSLEEYRFVDIDKIAVISHAEACNIVANILNDEVRIKTWVMLSPKSMPLVVDHDLDVKNGTIDGLLGMSRNYLEYLDKIRDKSVRLAEEIPSESKTMLGKRAFLARIRELPALNMGRDLSAVNIPVMVLIGKNDLSCETDFVADIKKIIFQRGSNNMSFVEFRDLGQYLGTEVFDPPVRRHFDADQEVMLSVLNWLNKYFYPGENGISGSIEAPAP